MTSYQIHTKTLGGNSMDEYTELLANMTQAMKEQGLGSNEAKDLARGISKTREDSVLQTVFKNVQLGQHNDVKAAELLNLLGDKK